MSDMTTAGIDLEAIEARANAATPGPWVSLPELEEIRSSDGTMIVWEMNSSPSDATFIAYARTDIPALIAEVRALRSHPNKAEG